jgi:hypothetical protein
MNKKKNMADRQTTKGSPTRAAGHSVDESTAAAECFCILLAPRGYRDVLVGAVVSAVVQTHPEHLVAMMTFLGVSALIQTVHYYSSLLITTHPERLVAMVTFWLVLSQPPNVLAHLEHLVCYKIW